jgi:D-3-phosphoglycerate dehydrogenase
MADGNKIVVRFNQWYDPVMEERFQREPDLELKTVERDGSDKSVWAELGRAHAFQVSSAKDELPQRWFVTSEMLSRCPNLLVVSSNGAGYDTVDVAACTRAGVLVVNQAGGNAQSVAEHTIGLMLDVTRRISENDRLLRTTRGFSREDIMGYEMSEKTVGIVGIGHIGTRVARLARAFDMTVLAVDPYLTEEEIGRRGATAVSREELLERSDFVSLHCPRNKDTMNMMNADDFARMKKGAIFVSTARGGIHNEAELLKALESGNLAGAGLDVWDQEPPPLDHPLLGLPYRRGDARSAAKHGAFRR